MDQKWIQILAILVFLQKTTSGAVKDITVKEGQSVDISCDPGPKTTLIVWFRVLENSDLQFIASFDRNGGVKSEPKTPKFSHEKIKLNILTLTSFNKAHDSGAYGCGSLISGNQLSFGKMTRLAGEKVAIISAPVPAATAKPDLCTTAQPCACGTDYITGKGSEAEEHSLSQFCTLVLIPLAGGCGLLLLLLIFTIVYCNHIRTRRCPHHYKRQPQATPREKLMMTNRHP